MKNTLLVILCCFFSACLYGEKTETKLSTEQLTEKVLAEKFEFVEFSFTDINGNLKAITLPTSRVQSALTNGLKFDGSSIAGCTSIYESDMHLEPDLSTFRTLPEALYPTKTGFILCDVYLKEGVPFQGSPRVILKKVEASLEEEDLQLLTGVELEFYLFKDKTPYDSFGYCDILSTKAAEIRTTFLQALMEAGVEVEKFHHEVAPGQFEIVLKYGKASNVADNIVLTKYLVHRIAEMYEIEASFMPKPIKEENGSGMHIHYSLYNTTTKKNIFFSNEGVYNLSNKAKSFLAGNLSLIREYSSFINASTNSYERLVPGYEAPIYICWGLQNRSALIRIPQVTEETAPYSVRAEIRAPDPSCNPYLAFSGIAVSGMRGIETQQEIPQEVSQNLYKISYEEVLERGIGSLPLSLEEALQELENGSLASEFFTQEFLKNYISIKRKSFSDADHNTVSLN